MSKLDGPCDLLELSANSAREELLRSENYCTFDLPDYFTFSALIADAHSAVTGKTRREVGSSKARDYEDVNFLVAHNKDGRLAWRPWALVHPVLYAALVDVITIDANWELIQRRFFKLNCEPDIRCSSRPVVGMTSKMRKDLEIHRWWEGAEQASIELALQYSYVVHTDVTNCYQSIYTHSIAWAIHTKEVARANKDDQQLIGNVIDKYLQDMSLGQTNGICQGSILMDLIAECVLAYADEQLASNLKGSYDGKYKILRHRDDYRIFVNDPKLGEEILKALSDVLRALGMSLNSGKTETSDDVIGAAIKRDKLAWLWRNKPEGDLQKKLLALRAHGLEYPNGGSVETGLHECYENFNGGVMEGAILPTIAIVADIAVRNPRAYPIAASLISLLIGQLEEGSAKQDAMRAVEDRFRRVPKAELMHVWVNRVGIKLGYDAFAESSLCKSVSNGSAEIWAHDWICDAQLKSKMLSGTIVDKMRIAELPEMVSKEEVEELTFVYDG